MALLMALLMALPMSMASIDLSTACCAYPLTALLTPYPLTALLTPYPLTAPQAAPLLWHRFRRQDRRRHQWRVSHGRCEPWAIGRVGYHAHPGGGSACVRAFRVTAGRPCLQYRCGRPGDQCPYRPCPLARVRAAVAGAAGCRVFGFGLAVTRRRGRGQPSARRSRVSALSVSAWSVSAWSVRAHALAGGRGLPAPPAAA